MRQAAARNAGVASLQPPFIVVAARLPINEPDVRFDASSKKVRLLCETLVHTHAAKFALKRGGWTVVSTTRVRELSDSDEIAKSCESISSCFASIFDFLKELTSASPFHLVTLSKSRDVPQDADLGVLLNRIEILLYEWVLAGLKEKYDSDDWWVKGVPQNLRVRCVQRVEEEGKQLPPEAYLTFIDLRDIVQHNWDIFGSNMEKMVNLSGKRRATEWFVELNELRKIWAHPIKQRFEPIAQENHERLGIYLKKILSFSK